MFMDRVIEWEGRKSLSVALRSSSLISSVIVSSYISINSIQGLPFFSTMSTVSSCLCDNRHSYRWSLIVVFTYTPPVMAHVEQLFIFLLENDNSRSLFTFQLGYTFFIYIMVVWDRTLLVIHSHMVIHKSMEIGYFKIWVSQKYA